MSKLTYPDVEGLISKTLKITFSGDKKTHYVLHEELRERRYRSGRQQHETMEKAEKANQERWR